MAITPSNPSIENKSQVSIKEMNKGSGDLQEVMDHGADGPHGP